MQIKMEKTANQDIDWFDIIIISWTKWTVASKQKVAVLW